MEDRDVEFILKMIKNLGNIADNHTQGLKALNRRLRALEQQGQPKYLVPIQDNARILKGSERREINQASYPDIGREPGFFVKLMMILGLLK